MLPKNRRIQRKEFPHILSQGRKYNSPHFLLYIYKKTPETLSNFAFSVSKKVLKKAVNRNTYRRRGYSIIKKFLPRIHPGFEFFFVYKKSNYPIAYTVLENEIQNLLESLRVL